MCTLVRNRVHGNSCNDNRAYVWESLSWHTAHQLAILAHVVPFRALRAEQSCYVLRVSRRESVG